MKKLLYLFLILSMTNACTKKSLSELAAAEDGGAGGGGNNGGGGGGNNGGGGGGSLTGGTAISLIPTLDQSLQVPSWAIYSKSEFSMSSFGTLVKDLGPGVAMPFEKFLPGNTNTTMFFTKYDTTNGSELWKTDGTNAGTVMVKDITPGSASSRFVVNCPIADTSMQFSDYYQSRTAYMNNGVFFTLTSCSGNYNGEENLWVSDGTDAGTKTVKELLSITDGPDANNNGNTTHYSVELIKQLNNEYILVAILKNDETTNGVQALGIYQHGYQLAIVGVSGLYKTIDIPLDNGNPDLSFFQGFSPGGFTFVNLDGDDVFVYSPTGYITFRLTDTTPTVVKLNTFVSSNAYTWGQYSRLNRKMMYFHDDQSNPPSVWKVWDAGTRSFVDNTAIPVATGLIHPNGTGYLFVKDSDSTMYRCNSGLTTCTQLQYNSAPAVTLSDRQVVIASGTFVLLDTGSSTCDIAVLKNDGTWNNLDSIKTVLSDANIATDFCAMTNGEVYMNNVNFHGPTSVFRAMTDATTHEIQYFYLDADFEVLTVQSIEGYDNSTRFMHEAFSDWMIGLQNAMMLNSMTTLQVPF